MRSWYWQEYDDQDLASLRKSFERLIENARDEIDRIEKELNLRNDIEQSRIFI